MPGLLQMCSKVFVMFVISEPKEKLEHDCFICSKSVSSLRVKGSFFYTLSGGERGRLNLPGRRVCAGPV